MNKGYFTVQSWMVTKLGLRTVERDMFAIVYGYSQDGESSYYSSIQWASDVTGYSKNSVCSALKSLTEKNLILKESIENSQRIRYRANLELVERTIQGTCIDENITIQTACIADDETIQGTCIINKVNTKNNKKQIKNNNSQKPLFESKDLSQKVVDEYHSICSNLPRVRSMTDKRKKAILSIVQKYGMDTVREVFTKANENDFLIGNNDRGWKASLDFIMKEDKFVKILEDGYGGRKQTVERVELNKERYTEKERQVIANDKYKKI